MKSDLCLHIPAVKVERNNSPFPLHSSRLLKTRQSSNKTFRLQLQNLICSLVNCHMQIWQDARSRQHLASYCSLEGFVVYIGPFSKLKLIYFRLEILVQKKVRL